MTQTHHGQAAHYCTPTDLDALLARRIECLREMYRAFNDRNIEAVLPCLHPDVDWPNGWEGGRLRGRDAVRRYWQRQWTELRANVHAMSFRERDDGRVEAAVRQVFRTPEGLLLLRADVHHVYAFDNDLVLHVHTEP